MDFPVVFSPFFLDSKEREAGELDPSRSSFSPSSPFSFEQGTRERSFTDALHLVTLLLSPFFFFRVIRWQTCGRHLARGTAPLAFLLFRRRRRRGELRKFTEPLSIVLLLYFSFFRKEEGIARSTASRSCVPLPSPFFFSRITIQEGSRQFDKVVVEARTLLFLPLSSFF